MKNKLNYIPIAALLSISTPSIADITFESNQAEISIPPACNHVPISIPYTPDSGSFDESTISVSSDSAWATPSVNAAEDAIEINFSTGSLFASYTATISVDDGDTVTELFISADVSPLDIYRLLDDPMRSVTYGIHRDGIYNGSIVAFDPVEEAITSCITVGESPTDFVINEDSTELLVINSVGQSINVIDLETFSHKETIALPTYNAWGDADETTANIDLGPSGIIYYSDGAWGPALHVLQRNTGTILQSLIFDGSSPSNNTGFMDFAVTSDKTHLVAMPQYGWSAGSHSSVIGQFSINSDGTVNVVKQTSLTDFSRAPFEAPVLMREDDQIAVMKTIATDPADIDNLDRAFTSAIWSMNPNGSVVATADKLYEYDTGIELYTIPGASSYNSGYTYTKAQAFTSDFTRFIYFNSTSRTLNVVNLIDTIGVELLGRSMSPANGAVVSSPESLTWGPLSGVDQYDVYLGTDESAVSSADNSSAIYVGRITGTSYTLTAPLVSGTEYFWRVDPVTAVGPEVGITYTFIASDIGLDVSEVEAQTVAGHSDYKVDIELTSQDAGETWSATAADNWITFTQSSGTTPSTLSVHLDASLLTNGFHRSSITLTTESGDLNIPVELEIDALNLTHIRSDRTSEYVYAISENTSEVISRAYLIEINSTTESIERVVPVGSSVTDFTIHYADDIIYVTNWKSGNLVAIDKTTFEHIKNHAFQPAGATGYSEGDVYRVAAGGSQRLVVEAQDQWVDISIYNTNTETILTDAFVREGGGAFDPSGRYYYHGENNSSGASIVKFDTSGDVFTNLAEVRPEEISSYYGSRTVVISEDGSRIFWAGVALDENLDTEWGISDIIYSSTTDGRYAFGETAIYDINLKRQVFAMPTSSRVSGYNSTSGKFVIQVDDSFAFYTLPTSDSFQAPVLSLSNSTNNSIELSWTDTTLEMAFEIQHRLLGASEWVDVQTTTENETSWTNYELQEGSSYEFRVRATASSYSSPWSNIAIKQEDDVLEVLGRNLTPLNSGIVNTPATLSWTSIPWISEYDIYLGTDENALATAGTDSSAYLGRATGTSFELSETLVNGTEYFWRIDPVEDSVAQTGQVYSFTVADIELDVTKVEASTFAGHTDYQVDVQLSSKDSVVAWTAVAADSWVTFTENSGSTPSTLSVHFDASELAVGTHTSTITLTTDSGQIAIPVELSASPLNITHIRSDRNSSTVYAISEDQSSEAGTAFLIEIDSENEYIQRVVPVGSSVTDLAIHYTDNLIYVTNWASGNLLALNKDSLELVKTIVFEPAGATGYSSGDVYRVAAGASQRLVVEEEDQWINIDIFNTNTEASMDVAFVREGGGAFDPTGRYYYHGENNSSGASIIKFDTSGDIFTVLNEIRPSEIASYYGSRTVVVSEDGSRIFWSGVALDENLDTEWATDDIIYSASADGTYAFGETSIYNINLKRQVLGMPTNSKVSGYNSTSEKLVVQVANQLKFFAISDSVMLPAPALNVSNPTYETVDLNWTDESLELSFHIQQRVLNSTSWVDVGNTSANVTSAFAYNLQDGLTYEFRVRANAGEYNSDWSNIALVTLPERPNVKPNAESDVVGLEQVASKTFNITENDWDSDGEVNLESIVIVTPPQFGQLEVNSGGEVTYTPGENFVNTDSFSYTIMDNDAATSDPATVTIIVAPTPTLSASNATYDSADLSWDLDTVSTAGFIIQVRYSSSNYWYDAAYIPGSVTNWTASDLDQGETYEFRVREDYAGDVAPWSNVVSVTTLQSQVTPNVLPIAVNDTITLSSNSGQRFSIAANDSDADGVLNLNSIAIVSGPQFGEITVNSGGEVTYVPGDNFNLSDMFTYTISDNDAGVSSPATVTVIYIPAPTLSVSNLAHDAIELTWNANGATDMEFIVQQRASGSENWVEMQSTATNVTSWTASDVEASSTYEFRVRATSSEYTSLWSNVAIATTTAAPAVESPETEQPETPSNNGGESSGNNTGSEKAGGGSLDLASLMLLLMALVLCRKGTPALRKQ